MKHLVLGLFVIVMGLPAAAAPDAAPRPSSQELPALAQQAQAAKDHLTAAKVAFTMPAEAAGLSFVISPNQATPLNAFAQTLFRTDGARAVYDVKYLDAHPYAAASFERESNTMLLPRSVIAAFDPADPVLHHEMVHADTWRNLRHGAPSPYYGFFDGAAYQPGSLFLDEMDAYYEDMKYGLRLLNAYLKAAPDAKKGVGTARLAEILEARVHEQPALPNLTKVEALWDGAAKKITHGRWNTDPGLDGLRVVDNLVQQGAKPTFELWHGVVAAVLPGSLDKKPFQAHVFLSASRGVDDPHNQDLFAKQLQWSLSAAQSRHDFWSAAEHAFREAVGQPSVDAKVLGLEGLEGRLFKRITASGSSFKDF